MFKVASIFVILVLSLVASQEESAFRIVNGLASPIIVNFQGVNQPVTIGSTDATSFVAVPGGSVVVTSVTNSTGAVLTNSSLLLNFTGSTVTYGAVFANGVFNLIEFTESTAGTPTGTQAAVRYIVLTNDYASSSLVVNGTTVGSFLTFLSASPYLPVNSGFSDITITSNGTNVATFTQSLAVNTAYTVFLFDASTGRQSGVTSDFQFNSTQSTTGAAMNSTTGAATTGAANGTTGAIATTGGMVNSTTGAATTAAATTADATTAAATTAAATTAAATTGAANATTGAVMTTGAMANATTGAAVNSTTGAFATTGNGTMTTGRTNVTMTSGRINGSTTSVTGVITTSANGSQLVSVMIGLVVLAIALAI